MTNEIKVTDNGEFYFGLKQRLYNWNMRSAREAKGWRQEDLSKATGIGKGVICHIETLRSFPNNGQAEKIAQALGRPTQQLFPGWLKEFKLERVPRSSAEEKIALHEIPLHLVPQRLLVCGPEEMEEAAERGLLKQRLNEVLETLTPRERKVLDLRFGLSDGRTRLLEEVGEYFGVGRECIRQIEAKALRKLRHPRRSNKLKDYLE